MFIGGWKVVSKWDTKRLFDNLMNIEGFCINRIDLNTN